MHKHKISFINRQAPKAVGEWVLGKKETDAEEYRPPFEVESEKKSK